MWLERDVVNECDYSCSITIFSVLLVVQKSMRMLEPASQHRRESEVLSSACPNTSLTIKCAAVQEHVRKLMTHTPEPLPPHIMSSKLALPSGPGCCIWYISCTCPAIIWIGIAHHLISQTLTTIVMLMNGVQPRTLASVVPSA